MQTFLPLPDFQESAACLDRQRLGKQRVECLQILKAIRDPTYGWQKHPAVRMWRGHNAALLLYAHRCCQEWTDRGYQDSMLDRYFSQWLPDGWVNDLQMPPWMGDNSFHASHRSNLLRKNPDHYSKFGWKESNELPYVWPVV